MQDKEDFIEKYIVKINDGKFTKNKKNKADMVKIFVSQTNMRNYLRNKFLDYIQNEDNISTLLVTLKDNEYTRKEVKEIANKHGFYHVDLETFYDQQLFLKIKNSLHTEDSVFKEELINSILTVFEHHLCKPTAEDLDTFDKNGFKYIKADLKKLTEKVIDLLGFGGFAMNLQNINAGVMTANAGDSAQFLFISRAILAGYNCSNVDVRSSRYDAVIDFEGTLLRIQVKGISGSTISFVDRDRGGQGIDHKHKSNRGKRITAKDCDLYVAVDKEVGLCYLIPIAEMDDKYPDEKQAKNISVKKLQEYKENWAQIEKVAKQK
ncbi:group I intron-associated PD-(D/E)XK endonuclease [Wohlfahrtiimonas larvae]|uniref:PD(D/E)XK endonuclease domain-containing protein n=1 Tax=Wohlfahrtiimonas larvae TaxID=1157986 RepID=A0ABP9MS42_9GAMM|nr:group I intron-associated PD-(D/E)XK endonuclease [Wohlfahrtiimonas larvae]